MLTSTKDGFEEFFLDQKKKMVGIQADVVMTNKTYQTIKKKLSIDLKTTFL